MTYRGLNFTNLA